MDAGPATLSEAFGVHLLRNFLVQDQILSLGHTYRVMDAQKNHLFTVQGDAGQNVSAGILEGTIGGYLGRYAGRSINMSYSLTDRAGTRWAVLQKQGSGNHSTFTLYDNAQRPWLMIEIQRGLVGGIQATARAPTGQPMMATSGNLIRHNFVIRDPQGQELAKVHEQWIAVRDTYNVDLIGAIDPLFPLVYAIAIDYEKIR
jgi:uncharacterized protein YxjI